MQLSKSVEMYLETIYLLERDHGHAHVNEIAQRMGFAKPSVTKAMDRLKENGFVFKQAYGHINLTEKGREISKKVFKKHTAITAFLQKTLQLPFEEAAQNACRMEHIITESMFDAILNFLKDNSEPVRMEGR
jgi:Mn-dependent DtxR family transcriptional regulator